MLQFTSINSQLAMNDRFSMNNEKATAKQFTPLQIDNCKLMIASPKGIA
jgi:hypothetical protein